MAVPTADLCILFADISGSTRLYELLGDEAARHKVLDCLEAMADVVEGFQGRVIKTVGDEIMCTFVDVDQAARASGEMHSTLQEDMTSNSDAGSLLLAIRVGMHFGPAIIETNDVFGDAVNVAARMVALAKPMQVLTTAATVDLMSPEVRATTRFIDRTPVRGKKDNIDIFEVLWQQEDVTRMQADAVSAEPAGELRLAYAQIVLRVNESRPVAVLGRSKGADLSIGEALASRQHMRVECRRGRFFVVDHSTNGTYLRADGQEFFLRREEMQLPGQGEISLGRPFSDAPGDIVQFDWQG